MINKKILGLLGLAARARKIAFGADSVENELKARKIKGFLSIICENSLRESQAEALRGNSVMETSKEDKKNHGFGVKNIMFQ